MLCFGPAGCAGLRGAVLEVPSPAAQPAGQWIAHFADLIDDLLQLKVNSWRFSLWQFTNEDDISIACQKLLVPGVAFSMFRKILKIDYITIFFNLSLFENTLSILILYCLATSKYVTFTTSKSCTELLLC